MAHRKKHHKKKHYRRRVGAMSLKGGIATIGSAILGGTLGLVAGRMVNTQLSKMTTPPSGTMVGAAEVAIGGLVALKVRNTFFKAVGVGLGSSGGYTLLGSSGLKVLPASIGYGPHDITMLPRSAMAGYRDVPRIGNFPKPHNIGFPKPQNIGAADRDRARMHRMYAGIYG